MKTLKYILVALLLSLTFVSCDPPSVEEEVGIENTKAFFTEGDDDEINRD